MVVAVVSGVRSGGTTASASADIWIVITEDRHADVEVTPFTDEAAAIAFAESEVPEDDEGSEREDLTDGMRRDGWVWYRGYGTEGDCVRVVRRELR